MKVVGHSVPKGLLEGLEKRLAARGLRPEAPDGVAAFGDEAVSEPIDLALRGMARESDLLASPRRQDWILGGRWRALPRRALRRVVLWALEEPLDHQRRFDRHVHDGFFHLASGLSTMREELDALRARPRRSAGRVDRQGPPR